MSDTPRPPPMPDAESEQRATRQGVRAMLMLESYGADDRVLTDWMKAQMGDRGDTIGAPDTSSNTLLTVSAALSTPGLYGLGAPKLSNADPAGEDLALLLLDGGVWERMQTVELLTRGIGDYVVAIDPCEDGLSIRNVEPWHLWTRCDPAHPDRVLEVRHRRPRYNPVTEEVEWFWDRFDIQNLVYDVIDKDGNSYGNLFLMSPDGSQAPVGGYQGKAYPYRYAKGKPFIPMVFYACQDTGHIWHEGGRRGATRGALNSMVYATYTGWVAHAATGSTVIAVGVRAPTGNQTGIGQQNPTVSIALQPGQIVFMQPSEEGGQPMISQVGPGGNLQVLSQYASGYEAQQGYREGVSADDVSRDTANPTSAAALSIRNSGKRAAADRIRPHFSRRDKELIRKAAAIARLAGLGVFPETGWGIEYKTIPLSPAEAKESFDLAVAECEAGVISKVDLYQRQHPSATREEAIRELQRIKADELLLEAGEPEEPGENETDGAESDTAGPEASASATTPIALTSTDIASIVTVDEARASQGLPPIGGTDGALTITAFQAKNASTIATAAQAAAGTPQPTT